MCLDKRSFAMENKNLYRTFSVYKHDYVTGFYNTSLKMVLSAVTSINNDSNHNGNKKIKLQATKLQRQKQTMHTHE